MVEEVPDSILKTLLEQIKELNSKIQELQAKVDENTRITSDIRNGFPGGDPDGHRRYHEEVIADTAERRKLRQELITHLTKSGVLAASGWLAWWLFKSLQTGILFK